MALKRVAAATDLSDRSDRAVERAASMTRELAAELQILHVVDADQPGALVDRAAREARSLLARQTDVLRGRGFGEPTALVRTGDPFEVIVDTAIEWQADLIVMGAHRKRILRDVFVGTTVERVIRTGPHPVLMVNQHPGGSYRRIVAATDMSPASAHALRTAKALGLLQGAELSILHAFEPLAKGKMIYANIERERIEEHVARETREAKRALEEFLSHLDLGSLRYDARLEEGPTFRSIRRGVGRERADLLVVGTRGLTGVKRLLLGSVADAVLRGIECDVLAVPPGSSAA